MRASGIAPGSSARIGALVRAAPLGGAALEPLDAATGVDQLLAAGVERVALGADLHVELGFGGARRELVAAGAANVGFYVLGVDSWLHGTESSGGPQLGR